MNIFTRQDVCSKFLGKMLLVSKEILSLKNTLFFKSKSNHNRNSPTASVKSGKRPKQQSLKESLKKNKKISFFSLGRIHLNRVSAIKAAQIDALLLVSSLKSNAYTPSPSHQQNQMVAAANASVRLRVCQ